MGLFLRKTIILNFFILSFSGLSAQPVFQWDQTFGGTDYEELHEIKPTYDGDIIYGGATQSPISGDVTGVPCFTDSLNFDFWLLKTDIYGNKIWDKRFGGSGIDRMWTVIQTSDGGYLLGGDSNSDASCDKTHNSIGGKFDMWIIKTDALGNKEWDMTYGTTGHDELQQLLELPDGSFFAFGHSDGLPGGAGNLTAENFGNLDLRLLKIASDGQLLWDKSYGGIGAEKGYKIIKASGDYLLGGFSTSVPDSGNKKSPLYGANDFWLVKVDGDGNIIWDNSYGGDTQDVLLNIERVNGGFLLGGQSDSPLSGTKTVDPVGLRDYYLVKIDNDGQQIWDNVYGGNGYDDGFSMYVNEDEEILFGGVSNSDASGDKVDNSQGGNDFWLLFLEPDGEIIWQLSYGGGRNDALTSIFPVSDGGVMLGGHSASNASGDKTHDNVGDNEKNDVWIIKTACKLELDLGPDTTICEGERIFLDVQQPNCNDCRYRWGDGDRTTVRIVEPPVTREYDIRISSRSGCEIRDTILVEVFNAPKEFFANITPPKCPGENTGSIRIEAIEGGTEPYYYSFNGGVFNELNHYFGLNSGDYFIELTDANECVMDTLIILPEPTDIDIFIDGSGEIQLGDSSLLVPIFTEPVDSFHWVAQPTLSCTDCLTPFAKPLETTTYALNFFNNNGCKFTESATVAVRKDRPVYFPSAFSPNNDGYNDHYGLFLGPGIKRVVNFSIYGRWGELLYEVKDHRPGDYLQGWNGYHRGKLMAPGAYVYFCEIEWEDDWRERVEGSFNLIR